MRLADMVLRAVSRLAKGPQALDDPNFLAELRRSAAHDVNASAVALYGPKSPEDFQITAQLPAGQAQVQAPQVRFGRAVELVAMNPTVVPIQNPALFPALRVPTPNDILVSIVVENEKNLTQGDGAQSTTVPSLYCQLSDFSVQLPRIVARKLNYPDAAIQFSFRWRLDPTSPVQFLDADIRVGLFTRYLSKWERDLGQESDQVNRQ